jgi:hypothetical protein
MRERGTRQRNINSSYLRGTNVLADNSIAIHIKKVQKKIVEVTGISKTKTENTIANI